MARVDWKKCRDGNLDAVKHAIEVGGLSVNMTYDRLKNDTFLHCALDCNQLPTILYLLSQGASAFVRNQYGETAMRRSCWHHYSEEGFQLLLDSITDLSCFLQINRAGKATPLQILLYVTSTPRQENKLKSLLLHPNARDLFTTPHAVENFVNAIQIAERDGRRVVAYLLRGAFAWFRHKHDWIAGCVAIARR